MSTNEDQDEIKPSAGARPQPGSRPESTTRPAPSLAELVREAAETGTGKTPALALPENREPDC